MAIAVKQISKEFVFFIIQQNQASKIIFKKIRDYQLPVLESSVVTESVLKADAAIFFNFPPPGIDIADFFHPLSFGEWKVKNDIIDNVHNAQLV